MFSVIVWQHVVKQLNKVCPCQTCEWKGCGQFLDTRRVIFSFCFLGKCHFGCKVESSRRMTLWINEWEASPVWPVWHFSLFCYMLVSLSKVMTAGRYPACTLILIQKSSYKIQTLFYYLVVDTSVSKAIQRQHMLTLSGPLVVVCTVYLFPTMVSPGFSFTKWRGTVTRSPVQPFSSVFLDHSQLSECLVSPVPVVLSIFFYARNCHTALDFCSTHHRSGQRFYICLSFYWSPFFVKNLLFPCKDYY